MFAATASDMGSTFRNEGHCVSLQGIGIVVFYRCDVSILCWRIGTLRESTNSGCVGGSVATTMVPLPDIAMLRHVSTGLT